MQKLCLQYSLRIPVTLIWTTWFPRTRSFRPTGISFACPVSAINTSGADRTISLHMRQFWTYSWTILISFQSIRPYDSSVDFNCWEMQFEDDFRNRRNWGHIHVGEPVAVGGKQGNSIYQLHCSKAEKPWKGFPESRTGSAVIFTKIMTAFSPTTYEWSANAKVTKKITVRATNHHQPQWDPQIQIGRNNWSPWAEHPRSP